jgi:hypothetical protein
LASATAGSGVFANFTIGSAQAISTEFDGVIISGQHKSNPADTAAADLLLSQQATQALGVAVKVQTAVIPEAAATTRPNDSAPFNAGATLAYTDGKTGKKSMCTTGFALKIGTSTYTTTARHCGGHAYTPIESTSSVLHLYTSRSLSSDGAARLLNVSGSRQMFYGGIRSSARAPLVLDAKTGAGSNHGTGDYVCTSGGNSGSHCGGGANLKVKGSTMWNDGYGSVSVLIADRIDKAVGVVKGDSGGPVYRNAANGKVTAVGMIQAVVTGDFKAPCGTTLTPSSACGSRLYYTSINTIIRGVPNSKLYVG